MTKKKRVETIAYRPFIALSADDLVDAICEASPSQEFFFDLIVKLELACADAVFLERLCKHFNRELKEQPA